MKRLSIFGYLFVLTMLIVCSKGNETMKYNGSISVNGIKVNVEMNIVPDKHRKELINVDMQLNIQNSTTNDLLIIPNNISLFPQNETYVLHNTLNTTNKIKIKPGLSKKIKASFKGLNSLLYTRYFKEAGKLKEYYTMPINFIQIEGEHLPITNIMTIKADKKDYTKYTKSYKQDKYIYVCTSDQEEIRNKIINTLQDSGAYFSADPQGINVFTGKFKFGMRAYFAKDNINIDMWIVNRGPVIILNKDYFTIKANNNKYTPYNDFSQINPAYKTPINTQNTNKNIYYIMRGQRFGFTFRYRIPVVDKFSLSLNGFTDIKTNTILSNINLLFKKLDI